MLPTPCGSIPASETRIDTKAQPRRSVFASLPKSRLLVALVAICFTTNTTLSQTMLANIRTDSDAMSVNSMQVIKLGIDPGKDQVWAILGHDEDRLSVLFEDLDSSNLFDDNLRTGTISQDPGTATNLGWTTWTLERGEFQTISSFGTRLTFVNRYPDGQLAKYFYESCFDPAASYIEIESSSGIQDIVVLYTFDAPVTLYPSNRCEEDIYAEPHRRISIIDPIITGKKLSDGKIALVGRSYASMPVAILLSPHIHIVGDGKHVYVLDKAVVDGVRQSAIEEHLNYVRRHPDLPDSGAALAALIEEKLLTLIRKD